MDVIGNATVPAADDVPAETVLVVVDGRDITRGDLDFLMISRRVPKTLRPKVERRFLEELIDRRLMQAFLASRKAEADPRALTAHVERLHRAIRKTDEDPAKLLAKLGHTEATVRAELALPLAWEAYARLLIDDARLREHFKAHRRRYDGTRLRARQILLKVNTNGESLELKVAEAKLAALRKEIAAGTLDFARAAAEHSQAPSKQQGGDVGFFPYRGAMPESFTKVAFTLGKGEISRPFRSPFGVHLCQVTDVKPGQLSLEDVRAVVFQALAREEWKKLVAGQRAKAKIVRLRPLD